MKTHYNISLKIVTFFLLYIFSIVPSHAQETKTFATKGITEMGGTVSYQYQGAVSQGNENYHYNIFSFAPYIGYFVSDNIQIGVNPLGVQKLWSGGSSTTQYRIFLAPAYNVMTKSNMYFFVEPQIGYNWLTYSGAFYPSDAKGFCWGTRAGVKIPTGGQGLLNIALQYQETTLNQATSTSRNGSNTFMFSFGFTVWD